jgi:serine/threonine protein kinase
MVTSNTILQGRYRVDGVLGRGGMGVVYLALDLRLGNPVAIKQTYFSDDALRRQFEREALLLANLRHPALPRVIDHFVEGDGQFIVMEFIPGEDLGAQLKRRGSPFEVGNVLEWAFQLLDALDFLHTQKPPVIHRDIKPQNLKVNERGQIMLLDFGLAKGAPHLLEPGSATSSVFGYTLNYAALEQIQGAGTEPRSDLFSFGATVYHLLTGITPPGALSRAAEIVSHRPDPLKPANLLNANVSVSVARVISESMALSIDDRPWSAYELRSRLVEATAKPLTDQLPKVPKVVATVGDEINKVNSPNLVAARLPKLEPDPADPFATRARPPQSTVAVRPKEQILVRPSVQARPQRRKERLEGIPPLVTVIVGVIILVFAGMFWYGLSRSDLAGLPTPPAGSFPRQPGSNEPARIEPGKVQVSTPPASGFQPPVLTKPAGGIVNGKARSMTLEWTRVPDAVGYQIETRDNDLANKQIVGTTSENSLEVPLTSHIFYVRVVAINDKGQTASMQWTRIGTQEALQALNQQPAPTSTPVTNH